MKNIVIEITDQDFIRRASYQAARDGKQDVTEWIKERALKAARASVGLDADASINEAAGLLGCHRNTVKNYMKAGKFPNLYYRTDRCCRIPLADIEAMKKQTVRV